MNQSPATCLSCMGSQVIADQPCLACASPDGLAQLEMLANPTAEEQQRELRMIERESLDALCALSAALDLKLLSFIGVSQVQGKALVELSIQQSGQPKILSFPGATPVEAFIEAGKEVHTQLMMVHTKRAIPWYVTSVATRQKIRQPPKIITSSN